MSTTTDSKPKSVVWNWITIILGLTILAAGMFSWFGEDEEMNNALIEAGIVQSTTSLVAEYPDAKPYLAKTADVLDAAVEARIADPKVLADLISDALSEASGTNVNVDAFVKVLIARINKAHEVSVTEEHFLDKVKLMSHGMRESLAP